jgi:hypothetical protein
MPGGWVGSDRAQRLPPDWPAITARIKRRDHGRCTWRTNGRRCTGNSDQVDHIQPGDDHSDRNLRSLCTAHHAAKSAREGVDARAAIRAKRLRPQPPHPGMLEGPRT